MHMFSLFEWVCLYVSCLFIWSVSFHPLPVFVYFMLSTNPRIECKRCRGKKKTQTLWHDTVGRLCMLTECIVCCMPCGVNQIEYKNKNRIYTRIYKWRYIKPAQLDSSFRCYTFSILRGAKRSDISCIYTILLCVCMRISLPVYFSCLYLCLFGRALATYVRQPRLESARTQCGCVGIAKTSTLFRSTGQQRDQQHK